jgi:hypothetical protein
MFSDKEKFADFPFFSFLKKIELLYSRFLSGPSGPVGPCARTEWMETYFLGPLTGPVGPLNILKITITVKKKLSQQKSKIEEIFLQNIIGKNHRSGVVCFLSKNTKSKILKSI